MKTTIKLLIVSMVLLAAAIPLAIAAPYEPQGSALLFPVFSSNSSNLSSTNTKISITNLNTSASVVVRCSFIYQNTTNSTVCDTYSKDFTLQPNQPIFFHTGDILPNKTGYAVCAAINSTHLVAHNFLLGKAWIKLADGVNGIYMPTIYSANFSGGTTNAGKLNMGTDYLPGAPQQIYTHTPSSTGSNYPRLYFGSSIASDAEYPATDVISGSLNGVINNLTFVIFDDATESNITITNGSCWGSYPINGSLDSRIPTLIPSGRTGWLNITKTPGTNNSTVFGNLPGGIFASIGPVWNFIHETHRTTASDNVSLPFMYTPSCGGTITTNTTLTADLGPCSGNGLNISANGITLDCDGHSITGFKTGSSGIYIDPATDVIIKNCNITNFSKGAHISNSIRNILVNSTFDGNVIGVRLQYSNDTIMNNCTANSGSEGIWLYYSNNTIINNCTANSNSESTLLEYSHNNIIANSTFNNSNYGIELRGSNYNNITYITAYSDTGVYMRTGSSYNNLISNVFNSNNRGIHIANSDSNTIYNNTANDHSFAGIYVTYSNYSNITENIFNNNGYGVYLVGGSSNALTNNTASNSAAYGFYIYSSSSNTLTNNTIKYSNNAGIYLYVSSNNNLINNTATNDSSGIYFYSNSNNNILTNNTVNDNTNSGIGIYTSSNNTLIDNAAYNNSWDYYSQSTSLNNTAYNLMLTTANVSFNGNDFAINASANPPAALNNISKFFNATNTSASGWAMINVSYDEPLPGGIYEASLGLYRYGGGSWQRLAVTGVNTANNYVWGNATVFSPFAPLSDAPPQVNLNLPGNNTQFNDTQNINFNFTATDDANTALSCGIYVDDILNQTNSSTANYTLTNFYITGISYGYHNWTVNCTDGVTANLSETRIFRIADTVIPVVTVVAPSPGNNSYVNNPMVTINATVVNGASNIDTCTLEFNGANSTMTKVGSGRSVTCNKATPPLFEGVHYFTVYANETSGNTGRDGVWFFTLDTVKPRINYNSATTLSGAYSQDWVFINITCNDTNIHTVILNWNGTNESFDNSAGLVFWENKTGLSDGTYTYYAWCNDSATNSNQTLAQNIKLDTTDPVVTVLYPTPANNSYINYSNPTINASAVNGASDIDTCILDLDSSNSTMTKVGSGNSVICYSNLVGLGEGSHSFAVYANETTTNIGSNGTWFFTVDTITPTIQFVSPTTASGVYSQNYIAANVTADDSNLDTIAVNLYNSTGLIQSQTSLTSPLFHNFTGLADGTYYLNATANDTLNHVNNTETRTITLDVMPPLIRVIIPPSPANNSVQASTTLELHVNVTDSISNISACILEFDGVNETMQINMTGTTAFCKSTKPLLSRTLHNFTVWANDTFGNVASNGTWFFTIQLPSERAPAAGGAPSAPSNIYEVPITRETQTFTLNTGDTANVVIQGFKHILRLAEVIDNQYVTVVIESDPITMYMREGEIRYVDVDRNGFDDLRVELIDIIEPNTAIIQVTILEEALPPPEQAAYTYCGDGSCANGETPESCPADCMQEVAYAAPTAMFSMQGGSITVFLSVILLAAMMYIVWTKFYSKYEVQVYKKRR